MIRAVYWLPCDFHVPPWPQLADHFLGEETRADSPVRITNMILEAVKMFHIWSRWEPAESLAEYVPKLVLAELGKRRDDNELIAEMFDSLSSS